MKTNKPWIINGTRYETAQKAAIANGVARSTIHNWCNGSKPRCKHIKSIRRLDNKLWLWNEGLETPYSAIGLGELLGVSRNTVYRWWNGELPGIEYKDVIFGVTDGAVEIIDWY